MANNVIVRELIFLGLLVIAGFYVVSNYFGFLEDIEIIRNILIGFLLVFDILLFFSLVVKKAWLVSDIFNFIAFLMIGLFIVDYFYIRMDSYIVQLSIMMYLAVTLFFAFIERSFRRKVNSRRKRRKKAKSSNPELAFMKRKARAKMARIDAAKATKKDQRTKAVAGNVSTSERPVAGASAKPAAAMKAPAATSSSSPTVPSSVVSRTSHMPAAQSAPDKLVQNHIHDNVVNYNLRSKTEDKRTILVGSSGGKRIHRANCIIAARIPRQKRRIFYSREPAVRAGFSPCAVCLPFNE
jgi:hypothetical protein